MARRRMIDPAIWTNRKFLRLSYFERLLFVGLVSQADDEGRLWNDGLALKAGIFPADSLPLEQVECGLERLASVDLISCDETAIQLIGWSEHQTIDRPKKSTIPEVKGEKKNDQKMAFADESANNRRTIDDESFLIEVKGIEVKGIETHRERVREDLPKKPETPGSPPTPDDLTRYAELWNSLGLPQYRKLPVIPGAFPRIGEVSESLRLYSPDEIVQAVKNYGDVVKHREKFAWGASYGSLANFLVAGLPTFEPGAFGALRKPESRTTPEARREIPDFEATKQTIGALQDDRETVDPSEIEALTRRRGA